MDYVTVPDLIPYIGGMSLTEANRPAILEALKKVPCDEGYRLTLLENFDVLYHPIETEGSYDAPPKTA